MIESVWGPRDWKPRRRGDRYCSPACGGNCSFEGFQDATKNAAKLAKTMGKGWKPEVWENLGWHWKAWSPSKHVSIYPFVFRGVVQHYSAYFNREAGQSGGHWTGEGKKPQQAYADVIKTVQAEARMLAEVLIIEGVFHEPGDALLEVRGGVDSAPRPHAAVPLQRRRGVRPSRARSRKPRRARR